MLNVYIPYKYLYPPLSSVHLCIVMAATKSGAKNAGQAAQCKCGNSYITLYTALSSFASFNRS